MRWISVKDQLPKNDEMVFVLTGTRNIDVSRYSGNFWVNDIGRSDSKVCYWCEAPETPEEFKPKFKRGERLISRKGIHRIVEVIDYDVSRYEVKCLATRNRLIVNEYDLYSFTLDI